MKPKVCCVFNYNPLYRLPIYKQIDESFDVDFFFGDTVFESIKQFNPKLLNGFVKYLKAVKVVKGVVWHSGLSDALNKKYTHYILTGNPSSIANWCILFYSILFHKKVYLWCHGVRNEVKSRIKRVFLRTFYRLSSGVLLYSNYSVQFMEKLGVDKDKLFVIHNSLNTDLQSHIYDTLVPSDIYTKHFKNSNPTLIYIGRIQKRKKVEQILDALNILNLQNRKINLVIVGASTDDKDFQKKINDYKLDNQVWMYGPCYDEAQNAELLYNADLCVSPGNVGLTCIHSLSYGTPVVSNDNFSEQMPEFEAVIQNKTGSFFKENNIDSLVEEIIKWTSITQEERYNVRKLGRKTILEEWSVAYQMNLLHTIIDM